MRLIDLRPRFVRFQERAVDPTLFVDGVMHPDGIERSFPAVQSLAEAQGIRFLCPKCFQANGGAKGTHSVLCWFEDKVPDDLAPGPGRWNPTGSGFEDLSFVPGKKSNSVLLLGACGWHGFIQNGDAT